jgi:ATP-binding cassette subfamily B multidrug efflux pump
MLRLARYLKPYIYLILLAIALLFVQANADLALPDYMSKIVNVGIQQGGVPNAIPVAIRQAEMNKLTIFMSVSDKTRVLFDYTLVDKNSSSFATNVKLYPILAQEPVYVLNKIDNIETAWLNPVIGKAFLVVAGIQQLMADPAKLSAMAAGMGFDLTKLPPGMDLFTVLGKIPADKLAALSSTFDSKFAALGDSMITQAAVAPVKAEYVALGMDTG